MAKPDCDVSQCETPCLSQRSGWSVRACPSARPAWHLSRRPKRPGSVARTVARSSSQTTNPPAMQGDSFVGDTGIEPVTSSVSGINTVLNTPPLSPKTVRERPVISPPYSRPLSRNSQSPQPPTCRRTSTDVPRVSPQAGTRHGQDIGIGLDGACVVARNRTRRRVAGCGGFPSGPVDLTLQEVRRRVRGAVARRQRSGPEQSSGTRPCGR
jgi:hypothetical protein